MMKAMKKYIFLLIAVSLVLVPACGDNDDEYTVIFNSNGGSVVSSQTVKSGGKIAKPQDPIYLGYTFDVWYKEKRSTTEWRFETDVVTENITLYANWDLGQITNPVVENLPGGARISYTFPDDIDFFFVKAEYYINGWRINQRRNL